VVICLEQAAYLHMVQLIPLPLTVSCSSKNQIGFTFLVPAHPGSPGQRAVKWVCMWCVIIWMWLLRPDQLAGQATQPLCSVDTPDAKYSADIRYWSRPGISPSRPGNDSYLGINSY